jgi:hypothetical protein
MARTPFPTGVEVFFGLCCAKDTWQPVLLYLPASWANANGAAHKIAKNAGFPVASQAKRNRTAPLRDKFDVKHGRTARAEIIFLGRTPTGQIQPYSED